MAEVKSGQMDEQQEPGIPEPVRERMEQRVRRGVSDVRPSVKSFIVQASTGM